MSGAGDRPRPRDAQHLPHCREKHLHGYLAEVDFRYNHQVKLGVDDTQRTSAIVKGAAGKRLTYQQPHSA